MSEYAWIKDRGEIKERDLIAEAQKRAGENSLFLALGTGTFEAGHAREEELSAIRPESLLELRIFSETQELCFRRSRTGVRFQWRLASEQGLSGEQYLVQYQTIDRNTDRMQKEEQPVDASGNRRMYTTAGGSYRLPAGPDEDTVKIIAFLVYDENGMAKISDYRVCGFVRSSQAAVPAKGETL